MKIKKYLRDLVIYSTLSGSIISGVVGSVDIINEGITYITGKNYHLSESLPKTNNCGCLSLGEVYKRKIEKGVGKKLGSYYK